MRSMLGKNFGRWHFGRFLLFFPKNRLSYFIQIVSLPVPENSLLFHANCEETTSMRKSKKNITNMSIYQGRVKGSVTNRFPWILSQVYFKMLHCTWMVCWTANDTRLFHANCFPTDRVISNWNRCSHIHWPIYLLYWNMDQKTEICSYIKCCIRLNIDSKQIFNELCGIYGPQTISMRSF